MKTKTTYKIVIYQDGEIKKTFENQNNDSNAFGWMLRNQHNSIDYALRYGGWKVEQINEQTGKSEFWKYYSR